MAIGGIDIGTTGCKISVYSETGGILYKTYLHYPAARSSNNHEINGASIIDAVLSLIAKASAEVSALECIGITSFGESFALLDENDTLLFPVMLCTDSRGDAEISAFSEKFGKDRISSITGAAPASMYSLAKLLWIKNKHPDVWSKTKHILLMQDLAVYFLTGKMQIDYSLAARTMLFNILAHDWSDELLVAAGIQRALLSNPVPTGTLAGYIKPELAESLGISRKLQIVSCCHDQIAATIGAGVFSSGAAADGMGTCECITPVFKKIPQKKDMFEKGFVIVPFIGSDHYVTYAFSFAGTAITQWFINTLAGTQQQPAAKKDLSIFASLENGMPDGPSGLLTLPHFAGAGTPYMDIRSKGAILGLSISSTASEIYQSVMEGIAFEMRMNTELLADFGIIITALHATGGGSSSRKWLQIKADIMDMPVASLKNIEAGTVGSVMLTGVAVGVYSCIEEAADVFIHKNETFYPRSRFRREYDGFYQNYRKLYTSVKPLIK